MLETTWLGSKMAEGGIFIKKIRIEQNSHNHTSGSKMSQLGGQTKSNNKTNNGLGILLNFNLRVIKLLLLILF